MKKITFIIVITVVTIFNSLAQTNIYTEFTGKVLFVDFSGLNNQIKGIYPILDNTINEFSLGWSIETQSANIGIYGNYSTLNNQNKGQKQTQFNGYGLGFKYSYNIINKPLIIMFPEIGFGLRKYNLTLGETANGVSIEDVLNYPIENYKFSNLGGYLDVGIGISKYFKFKLMRGIISNFGINISGGYRFDRGDWLYENINPVYNEVSNLSGIFINIGTKFRIGRIHRKED